MRKKSICRRIICACAAFFLLIALAAAGQSSMPVFAEEKADDLEKSYVYRLENGQLKYWPDLRGDDLQLHCMFQSESPEYYETIYTLDISSAEAFGKTVLVKKLTDGTGMDISKWFAFLSVTFVNNKAIMSVVRDERTLAGGTGNNLLTGSYEMNPEVPEGAVGSTGAQGALKAVKELLAEGNSSAAADSSKTYTPEELCKMAQEYYNRKNNYYPPVADYEEIEEGRYRLHLYEIVDDGGGITHTATSAWYTVDAHGRGTDDIYGNEIDLTK